MTRPSTDDLAAALRARAEATHAPDGALADRAIAGGLRRRRRTVAASLSGLAAALVLMVAVAVGTHQLGAFPPDGLPAGPVPAPPSPGTTWTWPTQSMHLPATPTTGQTMSTTVYLSKRQEAADAGSSDPCATVHAVQRTVPQTTGVTRAALTELLKGTTPQDQAQGLWSPFGAATAGALRSVTVQNGTAYVDLADLRSITPNSSTSCGGAAFLAQLTETTKAAAKVDRVLFAFDGQPRLFWDFLQRGCTPANDDCDYAPFRAAAPPSPAPSTSYAALPLGAPARPRAYLTAFVPTKPTMEVVFADGRRVALPEGVMNARLIDATAERAVALLHSPNRQGSADPDARLVVLEPGQPMRVLVSGSLGDGAVMSPDGRYVAVPEGVAPLTTGPNGTPVPPAPATLVVRSLDTGAELRRRTDVPVNGTGTIVWSGDRLYWVDYLARRTNAWNPVTDDLRFVPARPLDASPLLLVTADGVLMNPAEGEDCARYWDPVTGEGRTSRVCGPIGNAGVTPDGRSLLMVAATREWSQGPPPMQASILDLATGTRRPVPSPILGPTMLSSRLAWEDDTHILLASSEGEPTSRQVMGMVIVRCDVRSARCERAPAPIDMSDL